MCFPIDFACSPPSTRPQSVVSRPYYPPSRFSLLIFLFTDGHTHTPTTTVSAPDHIDSPTVPIHDFHDLFKKIFKLKPRVRITISCGPLSSLSLTRVQIETFPRGGFSPGPTERSRIVRENNRKAGYSNPRPATTLRRTIALEDGTTKRPSPTHIRRHRPSEPILIITLGIGHPWIITGTRCLSTSSRSQRFPLHPQCLPGIG